MLDVHARPHSPQASRLADLAHRYGVMLVVALLLACFLVLLLWLANTQQERVLVDGGRELAVRDEAAIQQADALIKSVEADLRIMDLWLQSHAAADPAADSSFRGLVDEMRQASGGMVDFHVASADGRVHEIPSSGTSEISPGDGVRHVDALLNPAGRAQVLNIGAPVLNSTGRWVLPVSWRMASTPRKVFLLLCEIDLEAVSHEQEQVRLKPGGTVLMLRHDGTILSRAPFDARRIGVGLSAMSEFRTDASMKRIGSYVSDNGGSDGPAQLVSYRRSENYPIVVMTTRPLADVMDEFEARSRIVSGLFAAFTLLSVGIATLMQKKQRALDHAQSELGRLASTDHLTDIMNRRALSELAEREFSRAQRLRHPLAILALDIDHFKLVNDSHGHSAGDQVLMECASRWKASLRAHDLLGRTGGEEFCAVLPDTSPEDALLVAQRLRLAVVEPQLTGVAHVTVSIGLSSWQPSDDSWSYALERADKALYRAKSTGRNRVCVEEPLAPPHASAEEHRVGVDTPDAKATATVVNDRAETASSDAASR